MAKAREEQIVSKKKTKASKDTAEVNNVDNRPVKSIIINDYLFRYSLPKVS